LSGCCGGRSPFEAGGLRPHVEPNYDKLLSRAREGLEDVMNNDARFVPPEPEVLYEGKRTILRNFSDMADALRREPDHFSKYLVQELGTAGSTEGRRLVLQGRVPEKKVAERVQAYLKAFVLCEECHRPDTNFQRRGRTLVLQCEGCGAHRPIRAGST
jgi:translation initiation factor 2 subunit 2